eukprot:scaffold10460_cov19-Tisochrysis_lutea.AAC.1
MFCCCPRSCAPLPAAVAAAANGGVGGHWGLALGMVGQQEALAPPPPLPSRSAAPHYHYHQQPHLLVQASTHAGS